jgi:hypothetical protein
VRARRSPITFRDQPGRLLRTRAGRCQSTVLMPGDGFGKPQDMETGGRPDRGVRGAVDVHYLSSGGARAAAVLAAYAAFAHVCWPNAPHWPPG